jgi:hypothetical protein
MNALESLVRTFVDLHPEDAARALEAVSQSDAVRVFKKLPLRVIVPLSERLSPHRIGPILADLSADRRKDILLAMDPRAAATVLQHLNDDRGDFRRRRPDGAANHRSRPGPIGGDLFDDGDGRGRIRVVSGAGRLVQADAALAREPCRTGRGVAFGCAIIENPEWRPPLPSLF